MSQIKDNAINACTRSNVSFCKFISANDAGVTGAHQSGFYIPKSCWKLMFDSPGDKGSNKEKNICLKWQDDFETHSCLRWYGVGSRDEYRITRFGKGFPFFSDEHVGSLLIISKVTDKEYLGYVLDSDEDIDGFLSYFNMNTSDTNGLITKREIIIPSLESLIKGYTNKLEIDFPKTEELSLVARELWFELNNNIKKTLDSKLIEWISVEYSVFKSLENNSYDVRLRSPFNSVDEFIEVANTIINRRKSRAGKSLEHHLEYIFKSTSIPYSKQAKTEGNKRPDFIFPSEQAYNDSQYPSSNLAFLGAKTTCKDRWRQVLNEADRIPEKHLFTLQQGISRNQLDEMYKYHVIIVTPKQYHDKFPKEYRDKILSLEEFVGLIKSKF